MSDDDAPTPVGKALGQDRAAMNFARKWKLVREDGTVKCLNDWCGGDATLPTLECRDCREARLRA